ncbi:MAG: alpha/beta fold hydrolase [Dehalococcoidia bacterium]
MPFVSAEDGVAIHYEAMGAGPPLVLLHGHSMSADRWIQTGYADALADRFRVIVLDLRGHGESGKPHEADAYRLSLLRDDLERVLDACNAKSAHAWGYSMGGCVVEELAVASPARVRSAVVGGWARSVRPPIEQDPRYAALERGIEAYVDLIGAQLTEAARQAFLRNDAAALLASLQSASQWPSEAAALSCKVLRYAGELDLAYGRIRAAAEQSDDQFVSLPGATHPSAFADRAAILPAVLAFLEAASAGDAERTS